MSFINDYLPQPTLHFNHPLLQFADITNPFLSTAALFSRFYSCRTETRAVKAASYLARSRSHMQYAIKIGRNCDFQVSQGSVATQLRRGGRPCNSYTEFPWVSVSEKIGKSVYICSRYDQKSSVFVF